MSNPKPPEHPMSRLQRAILIVTVVTLYFTFLRPEPAVAGPECTNYECWGPAACVWKPLKKCELTEDTCHVSSC